MCTPVNLSFTIHKLCFGAEANNVYPCKPQFYYKKVGFKVVKIIKACFRVFMFSPVRPTRTHISLRDVQSEQSGFFPHEKKN